MHNKTERDGMFVVRQASWHGLENKLFEDYPSRAEAQLIAHPWEPVEEPVYRRVTTVGELGPFTEFVEVSTHKAMVRDDGQGFLGVVGRDYTPVTNTELWDIAEAIEGLDSTEVKFETAGSLKGGSKVWVLVRMAEPLQVTGDPNGAVIPYYALQNAHDGSGSLRGQATMTRIVCDNTAQMADLDAQTRGTEFVFRHSVGVKDRIEEAKRALAGWRSSISAWQDLSADLMRRELMDPFADREYFVTDFIPMPPPSSVSDIVVNNVERGRNQLRAILAGPTCEGINHTAYGLVQASIEYVEHARRANSAENRFKRAYLDRNKIITQALDLALVIAK